MARIKWHNSLDILNTPAEWSVHDPVFDLDTRNVLLPIEYGGNDISQSKNISFQLIHAKLD